MKRDYESMLIILICATIGIIIAMIVRTLYNSGTIIDSYIKGSITITEVMSVIIILWLIVGVIVSLIRR